MINKLNLTTPQFLDFMKVKLIREYDDKNLVVSLDKFEKWYFFLNQAFNAYFLKGKFYSLLSSLNVFAFF